MKEIVLSNIQNNNVQESKFWIVNQTWDYIIIGRQSEMVLNILRNIENKAQ